jgi:hypothetical protein
MALKIPLPDLGRVPIVSGSGSPVPSWEGADKPGNGGQAHSGGAPPRVDIACGQCAAAGTAPAEPAREELLLREAIEKRATTAGGRCLHGHRGFDRTVAVGDAQAPTASAWSTSNARGCRRCPIADPGVGGTRTTGQLALRLTRSAVLPHSSAERADRRWVPITIRSQPSRRANDRMASAGSGEQRIASLVRSEPLSVPSSGPVRAANVVSW